MHLAVRPVLALDIGASGQFALLATNIDPSTGIDFAAANTQERWPSDTVSNQQEVSRLAEEIRQASQRLAWERTASTARLEKADLKARAMLAGLRQASLLGHDGRSASLLQYGTVENAGEASNTIEKPTLGQMAVQAWGQKSPALAGLLEVTVYAYVLAGCGLILFLTGVVSSMYARCTGQAEVPTVTAGVRFVAASNARTAADAEVGECVNQDWTRRQADVQPQGNPQELIRREEPMQVVAPTWKGYIDDDED